MSNHIRYSVPTPISGNIIRKLNLPLDIAGIQSEAVLRGLHRDQSIVYSFGQLLFWIGKMEGLVTEPADGTNKITILSPDLLNNREE